MWQKIWANSKRKKLGFACKKGEIFYFPQKRKLFQEVNTSPLKYVEEKTNLSHIIEENRGRKGRKENRGKKKEFLYVKNIIEENRETAGDLDIYI